MSDMVDVYTLDSKTQWNKKARESGKGEAARGWSGL